MDGGGETSVSGCPLRGRDRSLSCHNAVVIVANLVEDGCFESAGKTGKRLAGDNSRSGKRLKYDNVG